VVALAALAIVVPSGTESRLAAAQAAPQTQSNMQDMMKMHEQMMAEMKAGEGRLDALVAEMNSARGDAKVAAIGAVVNELVRQHKSMHVRMAQAHEQMTGGAAGR
jgi:hypothetical protein